MMLYTDFKKKYNVNSSAIKGLIPVSGVFDLAPLLKTDINDNPKMDLLEAHNLSPLFKSTTYLSTLVNILLAYGEQESDEFKEQSVNYSENLKNKLQFSNVKCIQVEDCDHFNIIENISEDTFSLTKVNFYQQKIKTWLSFGYKNLMAP